MAAFDLWAVSAAIATAAKRVPRMSQTYAWEPETPSTPAAWVRWRVVPILGDTFGGHLTIEGELVLVPGETVTQEAARTLYGWLSGGATGLRQVMEADPTLGGLAHDFRLSDSSEVGEIRTPFGDRWGAVVAFRVLAGRDA